MKPSNDLCPQCGFRVDPDNPSASVCPACGRDPQDARSLTVDHRPALLGDATAFAETLQTANEVLGSELSDEPEVGYLPDPELDFVIGEAEALMRALSNGPVLVAGNSLVS